MDNPFFTIGHASKQIDEFIMLLKLCDVNMLADVRSVPRSLSNPQFNKDILPLHLRENDVEYIHITALGGFRGKSKTIPSEVNSYWTHNSFHNYADYAMGDDFNVGLTQLLQLGKSNRVAIMCAEVLWWRCHRRIITDYLIARGCEVFHIISLNNVKKAELCADACINHGVISYPKKHGV